QAGAEGEDHAGADGRVVPAGGGPQYPRQGPTQQMNRRLPILAFAMLMLLPGLAAAQVYKCKGKSGETVYSEFPCDASAQPMKLRDDPVAAAAAPVADGTGTPAPQENNVS